MKSEFKIYRRPKYFFLYQENSLYWTFGIGVFLWWTTSFFGSVEFLVSIGNFAKVMVFGSCIMGSINLFTGFMEYAWFTNNSVDWLKFKSESIEVADKIYPIDGIKKIEIVCSDYKGMFQYPVGFEYMRSAGVDNLIKIELMNGEMQHIRFMQEYSHHIALARPELIVYYKQDILHYYNLLECLGISDYQEIQEFKKTLAYEAYKT